MFSNYNSIYKARYACILLIVFFIEACSGNSAVRNFHSEKQGLTADNGMVVSAHPEASRIGADILKKGGNAVDAAVATAFALAVCYPEAGNIGGGGFMLIRTGDGRYEVIDFREMAPLLSTRDMYLDNTGTVTEGISTQSHLASGVPGSVDGLISAHMKYGKLLFREVIQPAVFLAENGFPLPAEQAESLNSNREEFIERNPAGTSFVRDSIWKEGDLLIQKNLAGTLSRIRDFGREGFYAGTTARFIIKEMKKGNGIISEKDLEDYKSVSRMPLSADYKGFRIFTIPPPSGGGITLIQLLKMTEPYSLNDLDFHSSQAVHLIAEAERRSFADRSEYFGDPSFVDIPVNILTDNKYLSGRMSDFSLKKATPSNNIKPGILTRYESEETTHFSVVDKEGNAVAVTTTLNGTFGNSIVADSAGFILNNEMDDFSIQPGFPNMYGLIGGEANAISPGKRMLSSMTPVIVEKNGKLFLVAGSPGGSTIPTSVFQVIINVIDYGMGIQESVDAGRFHHQWFPDYITYENDCFDTATINKISSLGHLLKPRESIGQVNAIMILPEGKIAGGADKRSFNTACGY